MIFFFAKNHPKITLKGWCKNEDKKLVIDYSTKDVVIKIFDLYYSGYSYQKVSNLYKDVQDLYIYEFEQARIEYIVV